MRSALAEEESNDFSPLWRESELLVADALGRLMEFWGFKRHMGRIWGVLYMAPEPLTTTELSEVLQLSTSAVSLSLGELLKWGAVRKSWQPGERRDYYEVEGSVWKLLRRVFERRELSLIAEAADAFAAAEGGLKAIEDAMKAQGETQTRRLKHMRRRLSQLQRLAGVGDRIVRTLVAGRIIDPSALQTTEEETQ